MELYPGQVINDIEQSAFGILVRRGRHTVYSEDGLRNIIKCGTFVVVNGT